MPDILNSISTEEWGRQQAGRTGWMPSIAAGLGVLLAIVLAIYLNERAERHPLFWGPLTLLIASLSVASGVAWHTWHARTAKRVRAVEARYRILVEHIPAITYTHVVGQTDSVHYISPQVQQILGYTPQECMSGAGFFKNHLHPDDRAAVDAEDLRTNETGDTFRMECRLITRDGRYVWVRDEAVLVTGDTGRPEYWQGVIFDITERKQAETSLRLALAAARMGTWDWDLETGLLSWSEESETLHGLTPGTFSGAYDAFLAKVHPDDRSRVEAAVAAALAEGEDYETEYRILSDDGAMTWEYVKGKIARDATGRAVRMIGVAVDITERTEAEAQLRDAEMKYRTLVEQIAAVIYVDDVDEGERITRYISPQLESLLGYRPAEWIADPRLWATRLHPHDRERILAEVTRTTETGESFTVEYRVIARNGRVVWVRDEAIPVRQESGGAPSWHGILQDITERKTLEAQLAHQAFHDALTGLPNRLLFADRVEHALQSANRRGETLSVLFLDLDRFKVVNDSLGHEAGDRLLIEAGERIASCLRGADTIARFGGDEFAILLENAGPIEARQAASRIQAALRTPIRIADQDVFTTASIGITISADERATPSDLLRAADIALYQAKHAGRATTVVYEPGMAVQSATWIALEADLRQAIERAELILHFQPIVDLVSGEMRTVEALLRWDHPTRGILPPPAFLQLAEETGLINPIGAWVIDEACRQLGRWKRTLPTSPPTVNVNLSGRQLRDPDLIHRVTRALASADLDPSCLRLEITEEVLVEDLRATTGTLRALQDLGVRLAIDDFGAGASSLASLRELTVDALKLDRSFLRPASNGTDDEAIVAAIVAMAHRLGMRVTAEGIETDEQLALVRRAGCDNGQGFLLGRPVGAGRMTSMLARGSILELSDEIHTNGKRIEIIHAPLLA